MALLSAILKVLLHHGLEAHECLHSFECVQMHRYKKKHSEMCGVAKIRRFMYNNVYIFSDCCANHMQVYV